MLVIIKTKSKSKKTHSKHHSKHHSKTQTKHSMKKKLTSDIHTLVKKVKKIHRNPTVCNHLKKFRKCMKTNCKSLSNTSCGNNQCKIEKTNYENAFAKEYMKA
jgi:hypothetical protein